MHAFMVNLISKMSLLSEFLEGHYQFYREGQTLGQYLCAAGAKTVMRTETRIAKFYCVIA